MFLIREEIKGEGGWKIIKLTYQRGQITIQILENLKEKSYQKTIKCG